MPLMHLFPTPLYRAVDPTLIAMNPQLEAEILKLRTHDMETVSDPERKLIRQYAQVLGLTDELNDLEQDVEGVKL